MYLVATNLLRAKAGTGAANINYAIFTDEVSAGADSFTPSAAGQLSTSLATIYTAPGATQTLITEIQLANTSASAVASVQFFMTNALVTNHQLNGGFTIPANGSAVYAKNNEWKVYNSAGALITTVSVVASEVPSTPAGNLSSTNVQDALNELDSEKVAGPASVTDDLPAIFDGTTGKLIKSKTYAAFKTLLALVKGDVGLGNVDNTADSTKNVATAATLTTSRNIDGQAFNGSADITVIAPGTHAATSKATPVDADELPLVDSAASNVLKKLTWANLKATIKTYYDSVASTFTNKTFDTAGSGNSLSINGLAATSNTGTGAVVRTSSPAITTPTGIVKGDVGLGNVDNTSDVNKPVSTAQQTAIDAKVIDSIADADTTHAPSRNAVFDALALKQAQDSDLDDIAALTPTNDDVMQRKSGHWTNRTMAQFILDLPVVSTIAQGVMSIANLLRLTSQPRNAMSDVPGGTNCKLDGLYLLDATMTSGTSTINSASATFTAADVGKICGMNGAGIGGATLYGTITTRNSNTQIVVSFQASTTVASSGVFIYGTDDLTAYNAIIADGGRWIFPDIQEVNNRATRMLLSNAPSSIGQPNTQLLFSGSITNYDVGFNEHGSFMHIMRSNNPNTASATLGVTQLTNPAISFSAVIGASNQALKGVKIDGVTIECAGNVPIGVRGTSSQKGYVGDIHVKNPAYRAYDFTTVGGALGEATDYSKNMHVQLSARCLDGPTASTTAAGAVANLFANANLVLTNASTGGFSSSGGLGIAMTTIGGQVRPTLFQYTGISTNTLTGITCLYTIAGQSAALANLAVVAPAGPYWADGFVMDGDPNSQNAGAGNVPGNASLNHSYDCSIVHANGMARRYLNADSNKWIGFSVNRAAAGTGVGCGYWGAASATNTARNNMDLGGDPGAGGAVVYGPEMTGITAAALANRWYDYELGNGAPRPVNGTGAAITTSDFTVTFNGALIPALMNRGTGGVTGNAATVGGAGAAGATGLIPGMFVIMPPQGPALTTSGEFLVGLGKTAAGTALQLGMNYGIANSAADASVGVGTSWTGTAVADEMWVLVTWGFTAIGGSATLIIRTIPLRRQVDAATTGWVTTVVAYKALHTWTSVPFNSALSNPGPAYLSLQVRANTGTIPSVLPGSVAKINVA